MIYAVSYGMGHLLLTYEAVDPGFGLRYAARKLNPDELRSVTRHTLDKRARSTGDHCPWAATSGLSTWQISATSPARSSAALSGSAMTASS